MILEGKVKQPAPEKKEEPEKPVTDTINELRDEIKDPEVKGSLDSLMSSLVRLKVSEEKFGSGETDLIKLYDTYLVQLSRILAQYLLLEDSGNPEEIERTKKQLIGLITTVEEAVKKIDSSLSEDEYMRIRTEMSALSAKVKMDGRQQMKG